MRRERQFMRLEHQPLTRQNLVRPSQTEPICIAAPSVSGIGETEVLERIVIDLIALAAGGAAAGILTSPALIPIEVVVLSKRVTITECEVFTNKILVNGVLHKDLLFKFASLTEVSETALLSGGDCELTLAETLDLVVDCPFGACIPVPGACPGDTCLIENACIEAERELLIDTTGDTIADQFEEKVCILIQAKSIRNRQVTITPNAENICPGFTPIPDCPENSCMSNVGLPSSTFVTRRTGSTFG
jgi:hypothetical protein